MPTKACPHENGDGYPDILDSRFHGNDKNYSLNLMILKLLSYSAIVLYIII